MRTVSVFNNISLDGYFTDRNNEMNWAKRNNDDDEWNSFLAGNAKGEAILLFGRLTYDLMVSFWPTPFAMQMMPDVAANMNNDQKIVFSTTMETAEWNNTKLLKGNLVEEIKKMKGEPGPNIVILGSGTIVSQLCDADLIDEYQLVVTPVVLGAGRSLFEGVKNKKEMKLVKSRVFGNGNIFMCYAFE